MVEELQEQEDLTRDILSRLTDPREGVRENAAEALAIAAGDEDWRPDDLVLCDGVGTIIDLLSDGNTHVVRSALTVITALASAGHEEDLLSHGAIDALEQAQRHGDRGVREKAREALWALMPDVEERIAPEPIEED
ncbi:MAG TPA: HEAT repeat domain-containing protein [Methanomicrobiales archaeon]|nr:HEAT repeat domain-containing protein [Methanomicrobiales archaeon]